MGYKLEFTTTPLQTGLPPVLHFSKSDSAKIDTEIQSLIQKGALKQVQPEAEQFLSNLFLVPKRDGTSRPVINLKGLNGFLQYTHFKMEGIHLLRDLVQPGDWLTGQSRPEGCLFCSTDLEGSPQQLVSVRDLSQLIGKLTASIQAVFPAPLHYRHLQHLKHQGLARGSGYDSCLPLSREAREEIQWWLVHLEAWNGKAILSSPPDLVIETDASKVGWGAVCREVRTGGLWSQMEKKLHINCLELLAGSFAVKSFTKNRLCAHVRLRMDNTTAVAYVNRLGGTHSLVLSNLALALWEWAQKNSIMLSAEHYAGHLNTVANWESRHFRDASNWRLDQNVFSSLMQIRGPCAIDLFADRLNSQLPQFYSWKPDPLSIATDALLQDWSRGRNYAFPPFCLIMRSLAKLQGADGELILITPVWPTQAWYPRILDMSVAPPVLLPSFPDLLLSPRGERHPLLLNETLSLAAWHVSSNPCNRRAFLQTLPGSSWQHGGQAQSQFITPPGKKWHCWCDRRQIDPLCPTLANITSFLAWAFDEGFEYRTINTYLRYLECYRPLKVLRWVSIHSSSAC